MLMSNGLRAVSQSSTKTKKHGNAGSGFTLVEVLVSFIILAMFLGALYQTFSSGLKGAGRSEEYSAAVMQAESLLAAAGVSILLAEGDRNGQFADGHRWRMIVEPTVDAKKSQNGSPVAYDVTVVVSWGAEQTVRLRTIKWAKAQ